MKIKQPLIPSWTWDNFCYIVLKCSYFPTLTKDVIAVHSCNTVCGRLISPLKALNLFLVTYLYYSLYCHGRVGMSVNNRHEVF